MRILSWNRSLQKYPSIFFMVWCVCEIWQMPSLCFPQLPGRCELRAGSQIVGGLGDLRVKILAPPWNLCWINLHWIANDECRVNCWYIPRFTDLLLFETWLLGMSSREHRYRPTWREKDQVPFKEAGVRGWVVKREHEYQHTWEEKVAKGSGLGWAVKIKPQAELHGRALAHKQPRVEKYTLSQILLLTMPICNHWYLLQKVFEGLLRYSLFQHPLFFVWFYEVHPQKQ